MADSEEVLFLSTAGKFKRSQLNAAFRLIKHNVLYSTLFEILNLFTDCLGQASLEWTFQNGLNLNWKKKVYSRHTSLVGSCTHMIQPCNNWKLTKFFTKEIFLDNRKKGLSEIRSLMWIFESWRNVGDLTLCLITIWFFFFFHKTYTIGFRNLHICKPESSYLSSLRETGKETKELYPWL